MSIKITEKNSHKIAEALDELQHRTSVRNLRDYDVFCAAEEAEARLATLRIPKAERRGATALVGYRGHFPGSYRGRPEATFAELVRDSTGWRLVDVYRGSAVGRSRGSHLEVTLPQMTTDRLITALGRLAAECDVVVPTPVEPTDD